MISPGAAAPQASTAHLPIGREVRLADRYDVDEGPVALGGIHAIVRLVLDQLKEDRGAGRRVGGLVSGYPGSPLGGLDLEFGRQASRLAGLDLRFQPGVNEELAATAVWGSQLVPALTGARVEGVLGVWYGKSPGVDRAADALRHGNFAGAHPRGGMLALCGDDPQCKSSSIAGASEAVLAAIGIPTLYPGTPHEILEPGHHAIAMSRHSGLWTAMKIVTNVADASSVVNLSRSTTVPVFPEVEYRGQPYVHQPNGALVPPSSHAMEETLWGPRMELARAYIRANGLNRITHESPRATLGLVAAGTSYYELCEVLETFGLTGSDLSQLGVRVLKIGVIWPLEPEAVREFAHGLSTVVVIEDKGAFIESSIRDVLYGTGDTPEVIGKRDRDGRPLLPNSGILDQSVIAAALGPELLRLAPLAGVSDYLSRSLEKPLSDGPALARRTPVFCSGCPHNRSTDVPDGALVGAGIGCHAIVMITPKGKGDLTANTQMGGEGAQWIGQAPFIDAPHLFQNMGDGTFSHSGSLAIRAAVAAGVNVTFKLLRNSGVAMTGGQAIEGDMDVERLTRWLEAEGVRRVIVTTEDTARYRKAKLAAAVEIRDRSQLIEAQEELSRTAGVTVLIHDQECATELRRKRKRGQAVDPVMRVVINERVCEGCGDCGRKSHCVSVAPVETEFGDKTQVNQTSCNKDYSCLDGDCPSFLTVVPGRSPAAGNLRAPPDLPEPTINGPEAALRLVGIGGTGVVTVSQVLGVAAMLDGKRAIGLDQTGLAQKGGPVTSDLRIALADPREPSMARSSRIGPARADVYIAFDALAGAAPEALAAADPERTVAVISTSPVPTGDMIGDPVAARERNPRRAIETINASTRGADNVTFDALALSRSLLGSETPANCLVLGAAWQSGFIPLTRQAIEGAFRLNGVAIDTNLAAFHWGRALVARPDLVPGTDLPPADGAQPSPRVAALVREVGVADGSELARLLLVRADDLIGYQSVRYAKEYLGFVGRVHRRERVAGVSPDGDLAVTEAVARQLHRLMAYKDEYEVARLHLDPRERARIERDFGDGARVRYMLHPPVLRAVGLDRKIACGAWFEIVFRMLRVARRLRGTPLDVFGRARVRRVERSLPDEYRALVLAALPRLEEDPSGVLEVCCLPDMVRGYEGVKLANVERFRSRAAELVDRLASAVA